VTLPGAKEGIEFYMRPRWEGLLDPTTWVDAMGQVFFTLSLGMGAMLVYGSYLKKEWGIPANALACTLGNTSSSILAGFAIFPAAFALGFGAVVSGAESIGLTFLVLPRVFERMPAGWFFGGLFFILLTFGALSSAISIQEPSIAWLKDEVGWSRKRSALTTGVILYLMGFPFILNGFVKGGLGQKLALLSKMDIIIGQLALPLFGLLSVLAVGWVLKNKGFDELNEGAHFKLGKWIKPWMKIVVPSFAGLIFVTTLLKILQDAGKMPHIIPVREAKPFVSVGMTPTTITMMILVCGIIWGGFIFTTTAVLLIERKKKRRRSGK
jgi:NSS family neurotransmitter:Na+ symporter